MNNLGNNTNASGRNSQNSDNVFASTMLELGQQGDNLNYPAAENQSDDLYNHFTKALLRSGQHLSRRQQFEAEKQEKKEILRRKLYNRVEPINTYKLFSSREEETKRELEETRKELKLFTREFKKEAVEIDITLSSKIVTPGTDGGSYFSNFFHHLRLMIMLLRQRVSSASSWAKQGRIKSYEKRGLNFEKTKNVQSSINNERNAGANASG